MKNTIFVFLFCVASFLGNAQADQKINIGTIESIESKILGEQRNVWVYVPDENAGGPAFGKTKYPVVYLLDGDAHFVSVVGMIQQLSSVNGNTLCPKMIVVGIPNTDRTRDLTPTKGTAHPYVNEQMLAVSGGGENFMKFMEQELFPHIESNYPTEPYRMLIGHSFGGLTAMNALVNHTNLFNSYISLDPSMWWSDQKLLTEIKAETNSKKYEGVSLFVGIANTMDEGMDISQVEKDTAFSSEHIRSILDLQHHLNATANGLNFRAKYYPDDDHGSVPLIAEYDALRYIFKDYSLKIGMNDFMNPEADLVSRIEKHYERLTKNFGYEIKPEEQFINQMAYQFLQMEKLENAGHFFKLNVKNYPKSPNVYDSLGDFYIATNEKAKAIETLKKALAIKEVDYTRAKLVELEKEGKK